MGEGGRRCIDIKNFHGPLMKNCMFMFQKNYVPMMKKERGGRGDYMLTAS